MKLAACLPLVLALAAASATADSLPAVTVAPGTVSMSAGASFDLFEALEKKLSPEDMQATRQFVAQAFTNGALDRKIEMPEALAVKLDATRTQFAAEHNTEAVHSMDTTLGQWLRAALAKRTAAAKAAGKPVAAKPAPAKSTGK